MAVEGFDDRDDEEAAAAAEEEEEEKSRVREGDRKDDADEDEA